MSDPYVGEIRYLPYYTRGAPSGWLPCNGQLLPIGQYELLFSLISTTYGGDGSSTFGLPDLRGRVAIGAGTNPATGTNYPLGQTLGQETVTLTTQQIPTHSHAIQASTSGAGTPGTDPTGQVFASGQLLYSKVTSSTPSTTALAGTAIGITGGNQPHDNCAPTLPIQACIAYAGIYPSRP